MSGEPRIRALLRRAMDHELVMAVPAGVVAQVWRGGPRQALVARLLADPAGRHPPLDDVTARAVGLLSGRSRHRDVIDVRVALHAGQYGLSVVTSDPSDLHEVDPALDFIAL